jgi:hypothetical protein
MEVGLKKILVYLFVVLFLFVVIFYIFYINKHKQADINFFDVHKVFVTLIGKIKDVNNNNLRIVNDDGDIIDILLTDTTKIEKFTDKLKTKEEFAKENKLFNQELERRKVNNQNIFSISAPNWKKTEIIQASNLKIGDNLTVFAFLSDHKYFADKIMFNEIDNVRQAENIIKTSDYLEYEISGLILAINNRESIFFKPDFSNDNKNLEISITDYTKFFGRKKISDKEFEKAQDDFNNKKLNQPPNWYTESILSKENLYINDYLNILVKKNIESNIYTAVKIIKIIP